MPDPILNSEDPTNGASQTNTNLFSKLAGLQTIIPQFDNVSSVTPKFFIDNVEHITELANCSPDEKLLILRSRIRGDALSNIINSPDLSAEKDYNSFKEKFLAYFDTKLSLANRQSQFSNCRMLVNEPVKVYAARVAHATEQYFNNPDLSNQTEQNLFEQSKLSKLLEDMLPKYRKPTVLHDPQSLQHAINYVELLQANEKSFPSVGQHDSIHSETVNNTTEKISNDEFKKKLSRLLH